MGHTLFCVLSLFLLDSLTHGKSKLSNKVTVTLQPNWSQIYRGEKITLRCQIHGAGDTKWTYEWRTTSLYIPSSHSKYIINSADEYDSGDYSCRGRSDYSSTDWSDTITLTVSGYKPTPTLTPSNTVIPAGGRVTLTCSVDDSADWKYDWFRRDSSYSTTRPVTNVDPDRDISVSEGGLYHCRGRRGEPEFFTDDSREVTIKETVSNKVTVTLQPNWSQIYRGEKITLRCQIHGAGDTKWTYEWTTTSSYTPSSHSEYIINSVTENQRGRYWCAIKRGDSYTDWSDAFTLTVSDKPRPVLTVSPSWLSPGASVTLKCEVEHPSAGWSFYWYKTVPQRSHNYDDYYNYELLPGSTNGTEQDSYIIHGQTHTAGYVCRAGRGDPVYHTDYSEPKFVWSGDSHSAASLTVSPDSVQHFTSDTVSLSCEGNFTEWRVMRFPEDRYRHCSDWRRTTGSRCDIYTYRENSSVYWCESGSGEFSNAVNITTQDDYHHGIILVSPVHPVTEGQSVSLGCKFRTETCSSVFFYHNDKLIQNETWREMNISAVSKSHEGFYKCQCSGKESQQSWMSVKVEPRPVTSSSVSLIVGLVCGIMLIILLLICYCKKSKDPCCTRLTQAQRETQDSATDRTVNHDENQQQLYSSLLHADTCVYESIRGSKNTGEGP